MPGVSTTGTNRISIWTVANNSTRTTTNPTINGVATTEQIDSAAALPSLELADAAEPTAFGPVTVGTGSVLSGNARWAAQVFSLIPDTTAPAQTLAVTEGTNPGGQFFNSGTNTHYYNTGAGGDFTVTSTPTDADSGVTSVAFAAVALTGFTHTTDHGHDEPVHLEHLHVDEYEHDVAGREPDDRHRPQREHACRG